MARQRFIWPDLWSDPGFASLDPLAQVLYIGCFSNADDEGRLHGDTAFLRAIVLPRARVSQKKLDIAKRNMLEAMPKLLLYEIDGVQYLAFTNWSEWQKPKYPRPSRLPGLPDMVTDTVPEEQGNGSGNDSSVGWVGLGYTPHSPPKKTRRRRAAPEPKRVDPSKLCADCGATLGEGHHSHCPQLAKNRVQAHQ